MARYFFLILSIWSKKVFLRNTINEKIAKAFTKYLKGYTVIKLSCFMCTDIRKNKTEKIKYFLPPKTAI